MKIRDFFLALLVVSIWGINFTVIKLGVGQMPPMFLVCLRFFLATFPAIFFVKKPNVPWVYIIAYGLAVGVGQFAFLFYAIKIGMPAGLSSVVLQSQAFFTIVLARIFFKESIKLHHIIGLLVASLGLAFIGFSTSSGSSIAIGGFFFTLFAAFFWSVSNIIVVKITKIASEKQEKLNPLSLVVWSSLAPPIPMLLISLYFDSPQVLWQALLSINGMAIFAILYLSLLSTLVGYGIWSSLVSKYPATKVAPLSLMVPIFGLITAQIVLEEDLLPKEWIGAGIILLGLIILNFASYLKKEEKSPKDL